MVETLEPQMIIPITIAPSEQNLQMTNVPRLIQAFSRYNVELKSTWKKKMFMERCMDISYGLIGNVEATRIYTINFGKCLTSTCYLLAECSALALQMFAKHFASNYQVPVKHLSAA